jgi:uncharacterized protein (TIGR02996 family)
VSEQAGLLAAILADPSDDLPRRVYADWLDDHGGQPGAARAEFIRLQLELAGQPRDPERVRQLTSRQMTLWHQHGEVWLAEVPPPLRSGVGFRRGFIDEFQGRARAFFQNDPELFWKIAPVRILALAGATPAQLEILAATSDLARLTRLELSGADLPAAAVAGMLGSPHLTRLVWLGLHRLGVDRELIGLLDQLPLVRRLLSLSLRSNDLPDDGAQRLAECPALEDLRELDLSDNEIGDAGARALAESPWLNKVAVLRLDRNYIDNGGQTALRRRFGRRLRLGRQFT